LGKKVVTAERKIVYLQVTKRIGEIHQREKGGGRFGETKDPSP